MYEAQISAYFDRPEVRADLIAGISRLVAVKSVKGEAAPGQPFGPGPAAALAEGLALANEWGFSTENVENYVGTADLNEKETRLHILAHLDVVGEGQGWSTDPYTCVERDGMLYGRGVSDDKGPLVCALLAMRAVRELGLPVSANARLLMGTDEESGSSDIAYYYSKHPYAPYSFTSDADFPVIHVEKGQYHPTFGASWAEESALPRVTGLTGGFRTNVVPPEAECTVSGLTEEQVRPAAEETARRTGASFTCTGGAEGVSIRCAGKNAHAAYPDEGKNAIAALLELLERLPLAECESTRALRAMHALFPYGDNRGEALGIAQADEVSGPLTLNLALMTLTGTGFQAKFDVRFPACATRENCRNACEAHLGRHGFQVLADPDMTSVHYVPADSELVRTLLECYETYTGVTGARPTYMGGGTYVHDIPGGVAFGCAFPGFEARMHAPDEQASVELLLKACKIYALAIARLCR